MRIFFEGTVRVGATCCNKLNRGCEVVTDNLRREGKNEGIVQQAGHRITKYIHEKWAMETQDGGYCRAWRRSIQRRGDSVVARITGGGECDA